MHEKKFKFSAGNDLAAKYVDNITKYSITKFRSTINKVAKELDMKDYVEWKEYTDELLNEFEEYKKKYDHYAKRDQRTYKYKKAKENNQKMRQLYKNKMEELFEKLHAPRTEDGSIINMYEIFGNYEEQFGIPIWHANSSSEKRMWDRYVMYYFGSNEQSAIDNYEYFKKRARR